MTYLHLSREERYQISALLKAGLSQSQISMNLGRHKSTISREISRKAGLRGYRPRQASEVHQDISSPTTAQSSPASLSICGLTTMEHE